MSFNGLFLFCLFASAPSVSAAVADPVAEDGKKVTAVKKVIEMLEGLQVKVEEEGEKEAATYAEFRRFCETLTKEKQALIAKEKAANGVTEAVIDDLGSDRTLLKGDIGVEEGDLTETGLTAEEEKAKNKEAFLEFEKNNAEITGAITGVTEAIKVLKVSKPASLLQSQSMSKTLDTALMLADAWGVSAAKSSGTGFLQRRDVPEAEMASYNFHSSNIIEMLEGLKQAFTDKKHELDEEEATRVATYDKLRQHLHDTTEETTDELEGDQSSSAEKKSEQASKEGALKGDEATLADDEEYLKKLTAGCDAKAATYKERTETRTQELAALTEAIGIVKTTVAASAGEATASLAEIGHPLNFAEAVVNNEDSMEALEEEAEAEEAGPLATFLQTSATIQKHKGDGSVQTVVSLLSSQGARMKSAMLLDLASRIGADPFAKVQQLLTGMVGKLLEEAGEEANQKGYCDKALGDATQKKEYATEKVAELTAKVDQLSAEIDTLTEEIAEATKGAASLTASLEKANTLRAAEKVENEESIEEAKTGKTAVEQAMTVLDRFFKTAAKGEGAATTMPGATTTAAATTTVAAVLVLQQTKADPFGDAPEAGFEGGESYTGAQGAGTGIIGMLDVIKSDFTRTIEQTTADEEKAVTENRDLNTASTISINEKTTAATTKNRYKDEAEVKKEDSEMHLKTETEKVEAETKILEGLQKTCVDTGMTYAERKGRREQELESLKKALEILD
jgi:outer membrane murein-binding lipoprotein Lpp